MINGTLMSTNLEAPVSLQEQMTRARDGRVLALGPARCHGDNDDNDSNDGDGSRSVLDAVSADDHPQRGRRRLQAGSFASILASILCLVYYRYFWQSVLLFVSLLTLPIILKTAIEEALDVIEAASTGSLGEVCVNSAGFKSLPAGVTLDPRRYDTARQKVDMTAMVLQNIAGAEATRRNGELEPDPKVLARINSRQEEACEFIIQD